MRILSILAMSPPSPVVGGAELQMHSLHKALVGRGVEVKVLADSSVVPAACVFEGVPVWGAPFPVLTSHPLRPGNARLVRRTAQVLSTVVREIGPVDVVLASPMRQPAFLAWMIGALFGAPWVARLACTGTYGDTAFIRGNWLSSALTASMVRSMSSLVILDDSMRDEAVTLGVDPVRISVIPNALDPALFDLERPRADALSTIVYVGRIAEQKRLETLFRAVAILRAGPGGRAIPTLELVGGGVIERARRMATDAGLGADVTFHGHQSSVLSWWSHASCFVNPSESEGLPNAVLEACGAGVPVILSDIPVHRRIAEAVGMTSYLFPVGDARALAASLRILLELDTEAQGRLSANCRAFGRRFTRDRRDSAYHELFQRLAESNSARRRRNWP